MSNFTGLKVTKPSEMKHYRSSMATKYRGLDKPQERISKFSTFLFLSPQSLFD